MVRIVCIAYFGHHAVLRAVLSFSFPLLLWVWDRSPSTTQRIGSNFLPSSRKRSLPSAQSVHGVLIRCALQRLTNCVVVDFEQFGSLGSSDSGLIRSFSHRVSAHSISLHSSLLLVVVSTTLGYGRVGLPPARSLP